MTANRLIDKLKNINYDDIIESGEDYEGNPVFSIRFGNSVSTLTLGNQDINDYPEFNKE